MYKHYAHYLLSRNLRKAQDGNGPTIILNSREMYQLGHNNTARYLQCLLLNTMVIRNYLTVVVNGQYVSIIMTRSQTCCARM